MTLRVDCHNGFGSPFSFFSGIAGIALRYEGYEAEANLTKKN